jgi:hypothetical protein
MFRSRFENRYRNATLTAHSGPSEQRASAIHQESQLTMKNIRYGTLAMTRFRILVWQDANDDGVGLGDRRAYTINTYQTRAEAEDAARQYFEGLPYKFAIEEEAAVNYLALVA